MFYITFSFILMHGTYGKYLHYSMSKVSIILLVFCVPFLYRSDFRMSKQNKKAK